MAKKEKETKKEAPKVEEVLDSQDGVVLDWSEKETKVGD